jgi:hypothetical protein
VPKLVIEPLEAVQIEQQQSPLAVADSQVELLIEVVGQPAAVA